MSADLAWEETVSSPSWHRSDLAALVAASKYGMKKGNGEGQGKEKDKISTSIFPQLAQSSPARTPGGVVSGTSETTATFEENTRCLGFTHGVSNSVSVFITSREINRSEDNYC